MAVLLRMDNIVKEHSSSIAFTEENILLTYMSSPYLFCASLFSSPENINCLGPKEGRTILYSSAVSSMPRAGSPQKTD